MFDPDYIIKQEHEEDISQEHDELEYILPNTPSSDIFDLVSISDQINGENFPEPQNSLPITVKKECNVESDESLTDWSHETLQSEKGKVIRKVEIAQEPKLNTFKCEQCSYVTNHKGTLNRHNSIHLPQKIYEARRKNDTNKLTLINSTNKLFKCDQCSYVTKRKGNLSNHKNHLPDKPLKCDQCSYVTKVKWNLIKHKSIHSPDKPFKCDQCSFATKYKGSLNTHKLFHSPDKPFKCDQCSFATKHKGNLNTHRLIHSWN